MPFLRAGFNYRHRDTGIRGWTRPLDGHRPFAPASLICFTPKGPHTGDLAWLHNAEKPRFLAWGDAVVFGSWRSFELPWNHQHGLPHCDIVSRREYTSSGGWKQAA